MKVITSNQTSLDALKGVRISVIGYGAQGRAQAQCMHDSGLDVVVGARPGGKSHALAAEDGLRVLPLDEAAQKADLIHVLVPDEVHRQVYQTELARHVTPGKTLSFSHGFSIVYKRIEPPQDVDVILVAPKSPGTEERKAFLEGFGVPGLVAVHKDVSGQAKEKALSMAHSLGLTRAGVLECTFEEETYEDLFGEQAVLCGGVSELVKAGFETLTQAGYPPEMAYFECLHELKLIVDLMYAGGLSHMWDVVSNTAEYGGRTLGKKIIGPEVRQAMKETLDRVHDGSFAKAWVAEYEAGQPELNKIREEEREHPIEVIGRQVRDLFRPEPARN
jgi:ketol-acid reductoisomerase